MPIQLQAATREQANILGNLLQFYLYDFSVYFCDAPDGYVEKDGLFDPGFDLNRYFDQAGYWAYLARVEKQWAGFALISDRADQAPPGTPGRSVDEFFVMRCFRRKGIGRAMAFQIFDTYRGFWQIGAIEPNLPAQNFWRVAISAYTGGRYRESITDAYDEVIVWQTFDSSQWR
jgi:predicted acetyltransferase